MKTLLWCLVLFAVAAAVLTDDVELQLQSGVLVKMLREMVNQTKADTLNLPSNATSIRENITDTFSCENRTYGYYADVDNDCQVFHVCLPSQAVTGRNVTFRWSFICPAETVFNQEVLTCTRPRDAITCEESLMYYDVNMEFGKVNESKEQAKPEENAPETNPAQNTEPATTSPQRGTQANRKKQNLVVETLFNDIPNTKSTKENIKEYDNKIMDTVKEEIKNYNYNTLQTINKDFGSVSQNAHDLKEEIKGIEKEIVKITDGIMDRDKDKLQEIKDNIKEIVQYRNEEINSAASYDNMEPGIDVDSIVLPHGIQKKIEEMNAEPVMPVVVEEVMPSEAIEEVNKEDEDVTATEFDNSRIAAERSLKRTGRKMYRGSLRFSSTL